MTESFRKIRVAERFGQPPAWVDTLSAGELALLLAYDDVRRGQDG